MKPETEAFSSFKKAASSINNDELERWRAGGGWVAGYFCSSMPEEIITAAGMLPFRIRGTGSEGTELGVPFLHIGMDQFDKRYMSPDEVKAKISQVFSAMDLG